MYRNALFFADRLRSCIWALLPDANGIPKKGSSFRSPAWRCGRRTWRSRRPATCSTSTSGSTRSSASATRWPTRRPTAVATANVTSGDAPLPVTFSGLGSTDPEGDTLTYAWDLDGDNLLDDSTVAQPTFNYTTPGNYTVTLKVTDGAGAFSTATVVITVLDSGIRTLRFSPVADARVEQANASTNYGTNAKLGTDGPSTAVESLLRFNLAGIEGTIQSAKLRLTALRRHRRRPGSVLRRGRLDGDRRQVVQQAGPRAAPRWATRRAIATNAVAEFDVKSLVSGNGELNLGLRQPGDRRRQLRLARGRDRGPAAGARCHQGPAPDPDPTRTRRLTRPRRRRRRRPRSPRRARRSRCRTRARSSSPSRALLLAAAGIQHVLDNKAIIVVGSCIAPAR